MKLIKILKEAPASGTIHVDDVSVEDGIYVAKTEDCKAKYVILIGSEHYLSFFDGAYESGSYDSLTDLITVKSTDIFIHIPTGLRVTTEKLETDYVLWEDIEKDDAVLCYNNNGGFHIHYHIEEPNPNFTCYKILKE
jgi:hypothetical protein